MVGLLSTAICLDGTSNVVGVRARRTTDHWLIVSIQADCAGKCLSQFWQVDRDCPTIRRQGRRCRLARTWSLPETAGKA
jgi:hypothetical protein